MASLRARFVELVLRVTRRNRIYASADALHRDLESMRRTGPALPSPAMRRRTLVSEEAIDGRRVFVVEPTTQDFSIDVLYLHGGAYVRPITPHHWKLIERLVLDTKCRVTVPLYPLSPEEPYPAALDFVEGVCSRYGGTDPWVLIGDSAGGGLAVALAMRLRNQKRHLPKQLVLITPWMEVTVPAQEADDLDDPMLGIAGVREAGRLYAGHHSPNNPEVSPAHDDGADLPPILMFVAGRDLLSFDALQWARQASGAGCDITIRFEADMVHVWPLLPTSEGECARREIVRLLRGTRC